MFLILLLSVVITSLTINVNSCYIKGDKFSDHYQHDYTKIYDGDCISDNCNHHDVCHDMSSELISICHSTHTLSSSSSSSSDSSSSSSSNERGMDLYKYNNEGCKKKVDCELCRRTRLPENTYCKDVVLDGFCSVFIYHKCGACTYIGSTRECYKVSSSYTFDYCLTNPNCSMNETCIKGKCDCNSSYTRCGGCHGNCYNLSIDSTNCGLCGRNCPSNNECINGSCELICPRGLLSYNQHCYDLTSDSDNCGVIGNDCNNGTCVNGTCVCLPNYATCIFGQTCMADLLFGESNCGNCVVQANQNQTCISGDLVCNEGYDSCITLVDPITSALYSLHCDTNTNIDNNHCGVCDNVCITPYICNGGNCVCPGSFDTCGDVRACTIDLNTDSSNCDDCGNVCPINSYCSNGECVCGNPNQQICNGECVNVNTDSDNCGVCGSVCSSPGGCNLVKSCCGGRCTFPDVDVNNCGVCGRVCPNNTKCDNGLCCSFNEINCNGRCVDLSNDEVNCGSCGNECPPVNFLTPPKCTNGNCCPFNQIFCGFGCITPNYNTRCGSCTNKCNTLAEYCSTYINPNTNVSLSDCCPNINNSFNKYITCPTQTGIKCVNLKADNKNCGSCGNVCPLNNIFCVKGFCKSSLF